ncbi:histidine kinase [Paramagnetospirillum marisnigri]|uniref:histidine kinase n=1 Tax=Paramagnetospirillum marisnigri TaxID=1285242 RepID=A0A178MLZ5_9PROT|nr:stimulus-sensing domain-containing protein [Paramagnetospirillum marisnigri]OAN49197.1 histidine kinase [Paramagnetospirillum marisnigri]
MTSLHPRKLPRWRVLASPLTRRILAVNLLAPVVLVAGLFYLDHYKQELIRSELEGLGAQAAMIAAAIGEGAVMEADGGGYDLNPLVAPSMLRRLAEPAKLRARLFDRDGDQTADTRVRHSPKGAVQIEELPSIPRWSDRLRLSLEKHVGHLWEGETLPPYPEGHSPSAADFSEVGVALAGRPDWALRSRKGGGLMLTATAPVQHYKQVAGAVLLTSDDAAIGRSLFQVRVAILEIFTLSLGLTIGLSLYMAGTIARPIRKLALAAERVRHGHGRAHAIPDLSDRRDEIGELSLALKDMTEALWRRMDAIEAFAADVSHEIKNPLTSLRSAVETAARIENPEQQRRLMAIILDDVGRLNRLITDISDASRVDAEMSRIETAPVSMSGLLDTLAEVYGTTTADQGLRIVLDRPDDDPLTVMGLDSRLMQVLRNLIANAVSFSPPGGVIALGAQHRDGRIVVTVDDQGPGIPANKLEAIFERFYSERPEGEKFGTHSGLGLSISRQIIDAHGGSLTAANRDGGGARFILDLPAA